MRAMGAGAVLMVACMWGGASTPAIADDEITVHWENDTGSSIVVTSPPSCSPSGTCSYPTSISDGDTGLIEQQASPSNYIRSITFRYRYYDSSESTYKSCQLLYWTTREDEGCDDNAPSFLRSDGTGSSPVCELESYDADPEACDITIRVRMTD